MKNEMLDRGSLTLSQIVDLLLLNGTLTRCPGLAHGKMGIAIFFFHYARYTGNDLFQRYGWDLLEAVLNQVHATYRADYERGIAGIGVGIDYLIKNQFVEADSGIFEDFDERMMRATYYEPYANLTRDEGLTGYGDYWFCRQTDKRMSENAQACLNRIAEEIQKARPALSELEIHDTDRFLSRYEGKSVEPETVWKVGNPSDIVGLRDGYAGEGLLRLADLGGMDLTWQSLL